MTRVGFVIEHSLGHVTFKSMLQRAVDADPEIEPSWFLVEPDDMSWPATLRPFRHNYTAQASITARRLLGRAPRLDVLFLHTQTLMLLMGRLLGQVPGVLSTDATPRNIDEVGDGYWHFPGHPVAEELKRRAMGAAVRRAAYVVPWNHWARRSLVSDYGVERSRCQVLAPGIDLSSWAPVERPAPAGPPGRPLRLLFVGGQFDRKGGPELVEALSRLRSPWECDVVTRDDVPALAGLRAHRGLRQGDGQLRRLFREADVFVLPTRGDAMPWAVLEAMASGLPVVTTGVGAVPELVEDGRTGLIVPPRDAGALAGALGQLASAPGRRTRMGQLGRQRVERHFDASVNTAKLLALVKQAARRHQGRPGGRLRGVR